MGTIHKRILESLTKICFILLAAFPLMKENYNSIVIISCVLLTIFDIAIVKRSIKFSKKVFIFTMLFWVFLIREFIFFEINTKTILINLPFLIFPLLFYYRPNYINLKIFNKSITVFQISMVIEAMLFLIVFLTQYDLKDLFAVDKFNNPLFRQFIYSNAYILIHPTYFSLLFLISLSFSIYKIKNSKNKFNPILVFIHILNIVGALFYIFLLGSKNVLITLVVSLIFCMFWLVQNFGRKLSSILIITFIIIGGIFVIPFNKIISKRFNEIKTEINKPPQGLYFNSTNIRVAIFNCSLSLIKNVPLLGYGSNIQEELNNCYSKNYDSEFYKIQQYNSHNYYFNLILYGGWLFLVLFLMYIFFIFKNINYTKITLLIMLQLLLVNVTENFLSRHYGIITFNYFLMIFVFFKDEIKSKTILNKHNYSIL